MSSTALCVPGNPAWLWLALELQKMPGTCCYAHEYTLSVDIESPKCHRGACTSLQNYPLKVVSTGTALCHRVIGCRTKMKHL